MNKFDLLIIERCFAIVSEGAVNICFDDETGELSGRIYLDNRDGDGPAIYDLGFRDLEELFVILKSKELGYGLSWFIQEDSGIGSGDWYFWEEEL